MLFFLQARRTKRRTAVLKATCHVFAGVCVCVWPHGVEEESGGRGSFTQGHTGNAQPDHTYPCTVSEEVGEGRRRKFVCLIFLSSTTSQSHF